MFDKDKNQLSNIPLGVGIIIIYGIRMCVGITNLHVSIHYLMNISHFHCYRQSILSFLCR